MLSFQFSVRVWCERWLAACLRANHNTSRLTLISDPFVVDSCVQEQLLDCKFERSGNLPPAHFFWRGGGHVCACVLWYSHVLTVFVEALEGAKGLLLTLSLSLFLSVCLSSGPWLRASNSRDHGRVSSLPHWGGKTLPGGRGPCLNKQSGDETGTEAGWLCPSGWAATALWLKKGLLKGYCNHIRTHSIIS